MSDGLIEGEGWTYGLSGSTRSVENKRHIILERTSSFSRGDDPTTTFQNAILQFPINVHTEFQSTSGVKFHLQNGDA